LVALAAAFVLWNKAAWLRYYLLCWPANASVGGWRVELSITYVLLALDLLLPTAAALCIRHFPRAAIILAAIEIVLMPIALVVLSRWNTVVPN